MAGIALAIQSTLLLFISSVGIFIISHIVTLLPLTIIFFSTSFS